jgi:pyruvate kinase
MDGTDAVMLSAESAVGKHPVKAVQAMEEVINGAEKYQLTHSRVRHRVDGIVDRTEEAIAMAVMYTGQSHEGARHRRADRVRHHAAVDVALARRHPDLRVHAPRIDAPPRHAVSRRVPVPFDIPKCAPPSCSAPSSP